MASHPPTYTQRLTRSSAILEPSLHVSEYVFATPDVNPMETHNGLACRWFDRKTGQPAISMFIDQIDDVDKTLAGLRAQVTGEDYYEPGFASEVSGLGPGEYAFVRKFAHSVTAIVGHCRVSVHPPDDYQDLAELIEPALEIGRSVGCSAYENDYVPSPLPDDWPIKNWGIAPGTEGFPPGVPPGPPL
jgi:hypothetical protein